MSRLRTLLVPSLILSSCLAARVARAREKPAACHESAESPLWASPDAPTVGAPLRFLATSDAARAGSLVVLGPDGQRVAEAGPAARRGGPPASWSVTVDGPRAGRYEARFVDAATGEVRACKRVTVRRVPNKPPTAPQGAGAPVWIARRAWNRATEDLYSAWIEQLFDAPPEQPLGFRPLDQALRDAKRNFLHDHLGLAEDDPSNPKAIAASPDCADLPYFLRAYFAWKLGLPFGYRDCDRGSSTRAPKCGELATNEQPLDDGGPSPESPVAAMNRFLHQVGNRVHSGSARTLLDDELTDYYPVALDRASLRPGTIYADPYGHVLMVARWVEQAGDKSGMLLAVDGQPDTSIGRKRFWEGTFLFASDEPNAGPGFKAFRPLVRATGKAAAVPTTGAAADGGASATGTLAPLVPLTNAELSAADVKRRGFAPFSDEQAHLSREDFYARVGRVINPKGLDAERAYRDTLDALVEQLEARVGSVDLGERYMQKAPAAIEMPDGPKIFEWNGPWEDYATPSRDLRLLIAIRVLEGLPARIVQHPELFVLDGKRPEEVQGAVAALARRLAAERSVKYTRSDGSPWTITVADVLARKQALEVAYNPNDCVEVRWGALSDAERATCKRHAPTEQQRRMAEYRGWFANARRPPR